MCALLFSAPRLKCAMIAEIGDGNCTIKSQTEMNVRVVCERASQQIEGLSKCKVFIVYLFAVFVHLIFCKLECSL